MISVSQPGQPQWDLMSRTVYRISIMVPLLWILAAGPSFAAGSSDENDRWVPSLALTLGFTTQLHKGSVSSLQPNGFGGFQQFRDPDRNRKNLNSIHVGGLVEIQTPSLPIPIVHPRFFFGGEVVNVSSQRRSIARDGNPQPKLIEPATINFLDLAITGQGSATTSDMDTAQFGAHVGMSFPIELGDWLVSIKPSARYLNQEVQFRGIVSDGDRADKVSGVPPTRVVLIQGAEKLTVHSVGPGLEIEIAAGGVRSLAASLFISGGAYRVLSNREVSFTSTARDNLFNRRYVGTWNAEIDPWIYRANVGMRIKWTGLGEGWLGGL